MCATDVMEPLQEAPAARRRSSITFHKSTLPQPSLNPRPNSAPAAASDVAAAVERPQYHPRVALQLGGQCYVDSIPFICHQPLLQLAGIRALFCTVFKSYIAVFPSLLSPCGLIYFLLVLAGFISAEFAYMRTRFCPTPPPPTTTMTWITSILTNLNF